MTTFFHNIIHEMQSEGLIGPDDHILITAGGDYDRQVLVDAKIQNATISNLEPHAGQTQYSPYEWIRLDTEDLALSDNSYDWVFIHAGLHHLAVPAKGVCEMFRVARKGILCIESRDSLLMKLLVRFGLTVDYELEPVFLNDGKHGGYRNGPLPNYIYRWAEREFEKTINSYAPSHQHKFFYHYNFYFPHKRFSMMKNPLYRLVGKILSSLQSLAQIFIPKQSNQFAFGVIKNSRLQPWLNEDLSFKEEYLTHMYDKNKYKN